mmetsp:Transcript_9254/g.17056  ORF Transcript_9254/g.17056 Transcript_9254/m.17056 type:complete len:321 (-) Transcript_9254:644-1606(-)
MLSNQIIGLLGSSGAKLVWDGLERSLLFDVSEKGVHDLPGRKKLVVTNEGRLLTAQHIKNQAGVSVVNFRVTVTLRVAQVEFGLFHIRGQSWLLDVCLHVDGFFGLKADDQFVPWHVLAFAKHVCGSRRVLKLDAHFNTLLVQGLSGFHDEWNTIPPLVLDLHGDTRVGWLVRAFRDGLVVEVSWLTITSSVLTNHAVFRSPRFDGLKYLDLLVADIITVSFAGHFDRRLHGNDGENLHQMVLHYIANDTVVVKITAAAHCSDVFLERDDHRGNVVTVPEGLEKGVCKAQRDDVLHHLFSKIVIDTVEVVLRKKFSQIPS